MTVQLLYILNSMSLRDLPLDELVARLRKAGNVWFKNTDLLLLEELIRRVVLKDRKPT